MNDKPSEISSLTDDELAVELVQVDALIVSSASLPAFGHTPDPAMYTAISNRHGLLKAELDRRVML